MGRTGQEGLSTAPHPHPGCRYVGHCPLTAPWRCWPWRPGSGFRLSPSRALLEASPRDPTGQAPCSPLPCPCSCPPATRPPHRLGQGLVPTVTVSGVPTAWQQGNVVSPPGGAGAVPGGHALRRGTGSQTTRLWCGRSAHRSATFPPPPLLPATVRCVIPGQSQMRWCPECVEDDSHGEASSAAAVQPPAPRGPANDRRAGFPSPPQVCTCPCRRPLSSRAWPFCLGSKGHPQPCTPASRSDSPASQHRP